MNWQNNCGQRYYISNRELRIIIHRANDDIKKWYLTCYKINIYFLDLESLDLETAKKEAVQIVYDKINRLKIMGTEIKEFVCGKEEERNENFEN